MKNSLLSAVLTLGLSGCAYDGLLDMNENGYNYYSDVMAFSERCFQLDRVSPELMSDTVHNLGVVVSLLTHDANKLRQMYASKMDRLSDTENINCRSAEVQMRNVIAHGERIQRNQAAQASRPVFNTTPSVNKPIWCNTVGTITMCN